MELLLVLGIMLGFMLMAVKAASGKKTYTPRRPPPPPRRVSANNYPVTPPWPLRRTPPNLAWRRAVTPVRLLPYPHLGKTVVARWRRSVAGLVKLAETNLSSAERNLKAKADGYAVGFAVTSVENITRALLHCFGEKPYPGRGQEEALKLVSRRFCGDEKAEFMEAVENVAAINRNRVVQKYLKKSRVQTLIFNRNHVKQLVQCASETIAMFKRIMIKHFTNEIPELTDHSCPKCHSTSFSTLCFNKERIRLQCNICHHMWSEPRN